MGHIFVYCLYICFVFVAGFAVELFGTALFVMFIVSLKDKAAETQNIPPPAVPFLVGLVYAIIQLAAVSRNKPGSVLNLENRDF